MNELYVKQCAERTKIMDEQYTKQFAERRGMNAAPGVNGGLVGGSIATGQSSLELPLANRADSLTAGLAELNTRLADIRYRLFGDHEPDSEEPKNGPMPAVSGSIATAHRRLDAALDQATEIQNRL